MSIELIDTKACNGCRVCVDSCPTDVIRLDTIVKEKTEFPSCRLACPAGVDMRSYIYLLREGMYKQAMRVLRDSLPFPAITARVCHHPCESECSRREIDKAVNISALERFTADYWLGERAEPARKIYAAKTAVIGSGPAGLSCAYFLVKMGYPVTVFESMPALGGMLRFAIPDFRLPKNILDAQIAYIKDLGVQFKTGLAIGHDIAFKELYREYQAIFVAIGSQLSGKIDVPGSTLDGVVWGLDFLLASNGTKKPTMKEKVVVIGGGNVAIDVALTALRLGAKEVQLACLEPDTMIPASKEELQQARDEGVIINPSWGPKQILGTNNKVTGIDLVRCVNMFDWKGVFDPSCDDKITKTIETDMVILAVGQAPDLSSMPKEMSLTATQSIQADPVTMETNLPGVFAGGDAASGTSVVEAIAAGKRAAVSIDRFHKGENIKTGRYQKPDRVINPPKEGIEPIARQETEKLPLDERLGNFKEIKKGFDADTVRIEAQRCNTCGSKAIIAYVDECTLCLSCERDCPQKAIFVSPEKKTVPLMSWA